MTLFLAPPLFLAPRPGSAASRSDSALVTSYDYLADNVQTLKVTGSPTGGTFTLTIGGHTTSSIAYNASAATIETALAGLTGVGSGNISVVGKAGGPFTIRFIGSLAGAYHAPITAASSLTGGTSPSISNVITIPGGDAGMQQSVADPRDIITKTDFNMLGMSLDTIAAFTDGVPTSDTDQITAYTYDGNGDVVTMTAVMPSTTPNQTTAYIYGVGVSGGLYSNNLIAGVQYPDPSTGFASGSASNDVSYGYDNLGEVTVKVDQNGTTHSYTYDTLGRVALDAVTALGSGVDGSVMAVGYIYNALGLPYQQTSYSDAAGTTPVNQVQDIYNGFGQITSESQESTGAINVYTTPKVQYAYSTLATGSVLSEMIYPNGRILHFGYGSSGSLAVAIGRVAFLADDNGSGAVGSHLVDYTYQGLGTILSQADANGVTLTTTLDTFGNIAEMNWVKSGTSTDDFQYGYDRNGNVLYKKNVVSSSFSELYHANSSTSGDNNTSYDPLNRLTGFRRGALSASSNNGSGVLDTVSTLNSTSGLIGNQQSWSLDAVGNQTAVLTDSTWQTKSHNGQNELTGVDSSTLTYDGNGNMTTDENGNTLTYDSWNHLKTDSAGATSYDYDADGRRIDQTQSSVTTNFYVSTQDQLLEERQSSTVTAQNVFSIDFVNAVLLRDDNSTSGNLGISGSGLGLRLYDQHDANFNVTALTNTSGVVQQRFVYGSYGVQAVLTTAWLASGSANSVYGFQGGRCDIGTGLNYFDNRDYSPSLAVWIQADPAGYIAGQNMHQFVNSHPVDGTDPSGEYERDFHYNLIYHLMRMKCWSDVAAERVATASQAVDTDAATNPLQLGSDVATHHSNAEQAFAQGDIKTGNAERAAELSAAKTLADYHFSGSTQMRPTEMNDATSRDNVVAAFADGNLEAAGRWLHSYADSWSHDGFTAYYNGEINGRGDGKVAFALPGGRTVRLPIAPVGHAQAGHDPDLPYLDIPKALDAAENIYDLIPSKCKCGGKASPSLPWEEIMPGLKEAFGHRGDEISRGEKIDEFFSSLEEASPWLRGI